MRALLNLLASFICITSVGQDYSLLKERIHALENIKPDSLGRKELEAWWSSLASEQQIPLVVEDSVYFFYRGAAKSVEWMGDFNGWGYKKDFDNKGKKKAGTDLWYLKSSFPKDARLDYKILIDGKTSLLDPENIHQQWSGVGGGSPNSELRMPAWHEDPALIENQNVPKGILKRDLLINSSILGYQITYTVYLPYQYDKIEKYPVVYVTDGYEYLHPELGKMTTVLDNLIHEKKIKPVVGVFVDNREPVNRANNRRMSELAMNSKYLDFFVNELIPHIELTYTSKSEAKNRAILGTSMGGLTATYFAFTRPDIFGLVGIQSPAFYTKPQIYSLCSNSADPQMKISMTAGLINDTSSESRKMKGVLETSSCEYHYREVNEGHSWGNWSRLIDDILMDLFPIIH